MYLTDINPVGKSNEELLSMLKEECGVLFTDEQFGKLERTIGPLQSSLTTKRNLMDISSIARCIPDYLSEFLDLLVDEKDRDTKEYIIYCSKILSLEGSKMAESYISFVGKLTQTQPKIGVTRGVFNVVTNGEDLDEFFEIISNFDSCQMSSLTNIRGCTNVNKSLQIANEKGIVGYLLAEPREGDLLEKAEKLISSLEGYSTASQFKVV